MRTRRCPGRASRAGRLWFLNAPNEAKGVASSLHGFVRNPVLCALLGSGSGNRKAIVLSAAWAYNWCGFRID
jgi:hypothetical protein